MKKKQTEKHIIIFWILAILVNIKSIFADYDIDGAYALAMSYRHLTGDKMFRQMLEPHQTSAFLSDIILFPFLKITGSTTGAILWLHIWGVILYAAVTFVFFRFLKKHLNANLAHYICIFFFTVRAKQIVFPEFSNMMICFSILVFITFYSYLSEDKGTLFLVLSAVFLCLEILSYPSVIITFFILVFFIFKFSKKKLRDIMCFSSTCFLIGMSFILYFSQTLGIERLLRSLLAVIHGDSSHSASKVQNLFSLILNRDFYYGIGVLLISYTISRLIACIFPKTPVHSLTIGLFLFTEVIYIFTFGYNRSTPYYILAIVFPYITILGVVNIRGCSDKIKQMVTLGIGISACSLIGVIILSNLSMIVALWYIILAVCVSFIPISYSKKPTPSSGNVIMVFLLLVLAHRSLASADVISHSDILHIRNIYNCGPEAGIAASYFPAVQTNTNFEEWPNAVSPNDCLLIVGGTKVQNSTYYMFVPASISHYSTINTPTFNEYLLEYWKDNPDKYPTVIAMECWYGEMKVDPNSWIFQWVTSNYEVAYEGTFWRFYRPKA